MKIAFTLALAFFFSLLYGQPEESQRAFPGREKVEQAKVAFLTRKLDLSPEEAQGFWPIYNELEKKLQPLRRKRLRLLLPDKTKKESPSDERIRARVMAELNLREKQAQLRKTYFSRFEEALGTQKAAQYYRAEIEFNLHLMGRLEKFRRK